MSEIGVSDPIEDALALVVEREILGFGVWYDQDDPAWHDPRCMGECVACHGAEACGMVGMTCRPCVGRWGNCLPEPGGPLTAQRFPG